ncbi:MAG: hypothetical protein ACT4OF_06345 [Caulobacteraceae bacterium]
MRSFLGTAAEWFAVVVSLAALTYAAYSNLRTPDLSYTATSAVLVVADPRYRDAISLSIAPEFVNTSPSTVTHALIRNQSLRLIQGESSACFTYRADVRTRSRSTWDSGNRDCATDECIELPSLSLMLTYNSTNRTLSGGGVLADQQNYDRLAFDATAATCGVDPSGVAEIAPLDRASFIEQYAGGSAILRHEAVTELNGVVVGSCEVTFDDLHMAELRNTGWTNVACVNPDVQWNEPADHDPIASLLRRLF